MGCGDKGDKFILPASSTCLESQGDEDCDFGIYGKTNS